MKDQQQANVLQYTHNVLYMHIQNIYIMAQGALSMRVDETLKRNFDNICDDFGLSSTAAITLFMKTVVRERRIPFEIKASNKQQINAAAWDAFLQMREQAAAAGNEEISLEEINAEIKAVRDAR
jgi:addiction module antitoxin, RelB/DinJ family